MAIGEETKRLIPVGPLMVDINTRTCVGQGVREHLSPLELQVLMHLADPDFLQTTTLAKFISSDTASVGNILSKLNKKLPNVIENRRGFGYRLKME